MNMTIIKKLQALFISGVCKNEGKELANLLKGIAHKSKDGKLLVVSDKLVKVKSKINNELDVVAAIIAIDENLRSNWLKVIAARSIELGGMVNQNALVTLVTNLSGAAKWIEKALECASLKQTKLSEIERELFGVTAEQLQATPILVRVLATASQLVQWQESPLPELNKVDQAGLQPDDNWINGRLLELPENNAADQDYLLTGSYFNASNSDVMTWVLSKPWLYLLASISFVQDSWSAETHGGLLLELPNGQHPHQPSEIQVLVANDEGDELLCGTLAGFIQKILSRLNMGLFPTEISEAELNNLLSPIVGLLLQNKVWRYQEGLSGQQGFYQIHPEFADACYRITGARSFNLYGKALRKAIREQAEQWRIDQQNRARSREVAA